MSDPEPAVIEDRGAGGRPRAEIIKEIELILEAKKNINSILTTMYYVFYALLGALAVAFFLTTSVEGRTADAVFGLITLLMLIMITLRSRETNDRCDDRAVSLEASVGMRVIGNYLSPTSRQGAASLLRLRLHNILLLYDFVLIVFWAGLVAEGIR